MNEERGLSLAAGLGLVAIGVGASCGGLVAGGLAFAIPGVIVIFLAILVASK